MSVLSQVVDRLVAEVPSGAATDPIPESLDPAAVYVFHTRVTTATPTRFVVVSSGWAEHTADTYVADTEDQRGEVRLTVCAALPDDTKGSPGPMLEWLQAAVVSALRGWRPTVSGRSCQALRVFHERVSGSDEKLVGLINAFTVIDVPYAVI